MLRWTSKTTIVFTAFVALAGASSAAHAVERSTTVLQSPEGKNGLILVSRAGSVEVVSGKLDKTRFRIRREERLEAVSELTTGFVAAGIRDAGSETQIILLRGDDVGTRRIPSPGKTGALQLRPTPLVHRGSLIGLAWLEGSNLRKLRVRTADWDGAEWGPVRTVSRRSPGSQTGLTGTVLESGAALLVWSQFDGSDDELFFSWRRDNTWSRAQRIGVNNSQPDIAPSVTFTRRGALLAWSRFDGSDYRLLTARFDRGAWTVADAAGPPGSLYPQLLHRDGAIFSVHRSAWPRGWLIRRWDLSARQEGESFVASEGSERPVLAGADRSSVTLFWPLTRRTARSRLERLP